MYADCMYVYMYVLYVCMYIYVCKYVCMYVCMYEVLYKDTNCRIQHMYIHTCNYFGCSSFVGINQMQKEPTSRQSSCACANEL